MIDQIPEYTYLNNYDEVVSPVSEECIVDTAKRFNIPDSLIRAILKTENSGIGEIKINYNSSYNIGPMQINSSWLTKFENYVSYDEIIYNGCSNIQVGGWILKYHLNENKDDLSLALKDYHSNSYSSKIYENFIQDYQQQIIVAMNEFNTNHKKTT